ncbi:MAG: SMC-Scp complex subunit ScpB [Lachnospiraceae bacterium]|nr:SMC-Scp complex subunit ScpB [Lachnospiraceae bacterium]
METPIRNEIEQEAAVEAILFAKGSAVPLEDLARALGLEEEEADRIVHAFMEEWNSGEHGTEILELEGSFQMCTRRKYYPELITLELNPKKPRLSGAALEALSIIAYRQPVTKSEVDRIRGVNSDHAINRLIEFDLVCELGRAETPGRPILFGTTQEFLRLFGVSSPSDLPDISPKLEEKFKKEAEQEAGVKVGV